jgi:hypothetical protein
MEATDEEKRAFETYKIVLGLLNSEVNVNWQRLYNSLLVNSILLAAWAIIFTQWGACKWPWAPLLIGVSLFGLILNIFWESATARGNIYHSYWLLWLNFIEKKMGKGNRALVYNVFQQMHDHMRLLEFGEAISIDDSPTPQNRAVSKKGGVRWL